MRPPCCHPISHGARRPRVAELPSVRRALPAGGRGGRVWAAVRLSGQSAAVDSRQAPPVARGIQHPNDRHTVGLRQTSPAFSARQTKCSTRSRRAAVRSRTVGISAVAFAPRARSGLLVEWRCARPVSIRSRCCSGLPAAWPPAGLALCFSRRRESVRAPIRWRCCSGPGQSAHRRTVSSGRAKKCSCFAWEAFGWRGQHRCHGWQFMAITVINQARVGR